MTGPGSVLCGVVSSRPEKTSQMPMLRAQIGELRSGVVNSLALSVRHCVTHGRHTVPPGRHPHHKHRPCRISLEPTRLHFPLQMWAFLQT